MGGYRTAAAVIGGLGAALGVLIYFLSTVGWVAIGALSGYLWPTLVDLAFVGTSAAGLLLAGVGAAGAWLVLKGRTRRGASLMLISAAGIVAVFGAQPFLVNAAGAYGVPQRLQADPGLPPSDYFLASFAPAVPLLMGAALAFLVARGTTRP